jgi:hypothetical protein
MAAKKHIGQIVSFKQRFGRVEADGIVSHLADVVGVVAGEFVEDGRAFFKINIHGIGLRTVEASRCFRWLDDQAPAI